MLSDVPTWLLKKTIFFFSNRVINKYIEILLLIAKIFRLNFRAPDPGSRRAPSSQMCAIRRILRIFLPQYIHPSIRSDQNRTFLSVERHFFLLTILAYTFSQNSIYLLTNSAYIFSQNSIYLLTILAYIFSQNSMTYNYLTKRLSGSQTKKMRKVLGSQTKKRRKVVRITN